MALHSGSAANRAPSDHYSAAYIPRDHAHEAALVQQHGVEAKLMPDLPSRRLLRQFNFELKRSQQPTDRVDLVERSAQLSFRAWR